MLAIAFSPIKAKYKTPSGKSIYSTTGIIECMSAFDLLSPDHKFSLIGSAGALGTDVPMYIRSHGYRIAGVCDLDYDSKTQRIPNH